VRARRSRSCGRWECWPARDPTPDGGVGELEDAGGGLGTEAFGDGVEHLSDDEEDGKLELPSTFSALEKLPSKTSKLKVGSLGIYDTLGPVVPQLTHDNSMLTP